MKNQSNSVGMTREEDDSRSKRIDLIYDLFSLALVVFLLLTLMETVWHENLATGLSPNLILILLIPLSIIIILTAEEESKIPVEVTPRDFVLISITGVWCILMVWYTIRSISWISHVISVMAGVLVILISMLMLKGQ